MNEFIQGQLASNKENIQIIMNKVDESISESLRNEIINRIIINLLTEL